MELKEIAAELHPNSCWKLFCQLNYSDDLENMIREVKNQHFSKAGLNHYNEVKF